MSRPPPVPGLKPPTPFEIHGNTAQNWKLFKIKWNNYVTLSHLDLQPVQYQVALFISCLSDDAVRLYDGFDFATTEGNRTLLEIIDKFESFSVGNVNVTFERAMFNRRDQLEDETFDTYLAVLRSMIKTCNFCSGCESSLLRDRIVVGVRDRDVHKELVRDRNLDLGRCIDVCKSAEQAKAEGQLLRPENVTALAADLAVVRSEDRMGSLTGIRNCKFCGRKHEFRRECCPAWNKVCKKCGLLNHFGNMCNTTNAGYRRQDYGGSRKSGAPVRVVDDWEKPEGKAGNWVNMVHSRHLQPKSEAKCKMIVGGKTIHFLLDTGASVNLLPFSLIQDREFILPCTKTLRMWNNSEMVPIGTYRTVVRNPKTDCKLSLEFIVVEGNHVPILGLRACEEMQLIRIQDQNIDRVAQIVDSGNLQGSLEKLVGSPICQKRGFKSVFSGELGTLPGKVTLRVDPDVHPVISPPRRTPVALQAKLKVELDRLLGLGIIASVEQPTEWVNQFVMVPKPDGTIRLCLDPVNLNKALLRERYTMPIMDDVLHELADSDTFSKCDLQWGFWHVELEEASSFLTTFQTPFGRFRWLRLPFGLSVSPEIFQRKLHEAIGDVPGIVEVADDVVVHGKGSQAHDKNFETFIARCDEQNIRLNAKKLEFRRDQITFMGHLITRQGIRVEESKIEAIKNFPVPLSVSDLRRFLGMINFLARYVPHLAHHAEPLHNLLKKEVPWVWAGAQQAAFDGLKEALAQQTCLTIFDKNEMSTLECDASDYGLGAALFQKGRPVAFASRTLSPTERGYAQIEKEMLAVVFGLEKFHHFVFGARVLVRSDHKPLLAIVGKPLSQAPRRLQSMLMRARHYCFDLQYVPGKEHVVADTLSRAPLIPTLEKTSRNPEVEDVWLVKSLPVNDFYLPILQQHTEKDDVLQEVILYIKSGWPDKTTNMSPGASRFFYHRDEMAIANGVVVRGERVVIPNSLRQDIKQKLHAGHQGINATLRRARELVFWPGMSTDIHHFIESCGTCNHFAPAQRQEPMILSEVPPGPWWKVGLDIFCIKGRNYLVLIDYFSKFIEVDYLPDLLAITVISKIKHHFARHGIPQEVVSDGGTQFTAGEFRKFASTWGFRHIFSSPGNSQANGQAEAAVKVVKQMMKKALRDKSDPYLGLLAMRNTPMVDVNKSPAQILFGRATRTTIPTSAEVLISKAPDMQLVQRQLQDRQYRIAQADHRVQPELTPLKVGGQVWHRNPLEGREAHWRPATILQQESNRSYEILTETGSQLRRNRRFLRPQVGSPERRDIRIERTPERSSENENEETNGSSGWTGEEDKRKEIVEQQGEWKTRRGRIIKPPRRLDL